VLDVASRVLEVAPPAPAVVPLDGVDPGASELPQAASAMPIGIHRQANQRAK
jgi:hypothetical protein